jgi:hypothetical protein
MKTYLTQISRSLSQKVRKISIQIRKFRMIMPSRKAIMFSALLFVFGIVLFGKIYSSLEGKTVELTSGKVLGGIQGREGDALQ